MKILFVVSHPDPYPCDMPGISMIPAGEYLMDSEYGGSEPTRLFNLCDCYDHETHGYYVSLLAEARQHHPLPDIEAIKSLESEEFVQTANEKLQCLMTTALSGVSTESFCCDIVFGQVSKDEMKFLANQLFRLSQIPILHVEFERGNNGWRLLKVSPGSMTSLRNGSLSSFNSAAKDFLRESKIRVSKSPNVKPSIAILHEPGSLTYPSNSKAMVKFVEATETVGMSAELITVADANRLTDFDALFIRATTSVNHYTYEFARRAAAANMVVIDHPDSILKCTNKIYLAELFARNHILTPKTLIVHRDNIDQIIPTLGLPCILKQPDSAFSLGVIKAENEQELYAYASELLIGSELILAQSFLPTSFDWRVGILDRRPLFVCKYFMAPHHWQIIKRDQKAVQEGKTQALALGEVPNEVVKVSLEAASLIGDGFYGVDLKQVGNHYYIIEINDNPNVDAGNEDGILKDALYREVMGVFRKRVDAINGC